MKVYTIHTDDGYSLALVAIVKSKEVAEQFVKEMKEKEREWSYDFSICEYNLYESVSEWKPKPVYEVDFNVRGIEISRRVFWLYPDIDEDEIDTEIKVYSYVRNWEGSGVGRSLISYEDAIKDFQEKRSELYNDTNMENK